MPKSFKEFPSGVQAVVFVLIIVVVVGAADYFGLYFVFPGGLVALHEQIVAKQKEWDGLQQKIKQLEAFESKLTEYHNRVTQLEKELATLSLILPETRQTDLFMKTVFADAGATSVHVRTFIPQAENQKDFYAEMPFAVRLDGTYWALVNLFAKLANEQRIVSVTSVGLGQPSGGGMGAYTVSENETVGANAVLTTYYRHEAASRPAGRPAPPARR